MSVEGGNSTGSCRAVTLTGKKQMQGSRSVFPLDVFMSGWLPTVREGRRYCPLLGRVLSPHFIFYGYTLTTPAREVYLLIDSKSTRLATKINHPMAIRTEIHSWSKCRENFEYQS